MMNLQNVFADKLAKMALIRNEFEYLEKKFDFYDIHFLRDDSLVFVSPQKSDPELIITDVDLASNNDCSYRAYFKNKYTGEQSKYLYYKGLLNAIEHAVKFYKENHD